MGAMAARHVRAVGAASSASEIEGSDLFTAQTHHPNSSPPTTRAIAKNGSKGLDCITLSRRKAGPHYFGCVTSQVPIFEIIISCCVSEGYDLSVAPS